jgi:signal peptidase I
VHQEPIERDSVVLDEEEAKKREAEERRLRRLRRLFPFLLVIVFLVYGFTTNLIPSSSMEPTLKTGDQILTIRAWLAYFGGKAPSRGDIVIFNLPPDQGKLAGELPFDDQPEGRKPIGVFRNPPGEILIKRVVGLPEETMTLKDGRVYANGKVVEQPYQTVAPEEGSDFDYPFGGAQPLKVGPDEVFVMGDNRLVSEDSRSFGPVKLRNIRGRFIARLFHRNIDDPLSAKLKQAEENMRSMRPLRRPRLDDGH